jgi:hypothetical protein
MLSANVLRLSNILFHYIHHFPVRYYFFFEEMILVTKMCCLWKYTLKDTITTDDYDIGRGVHAKQQLIYFKQ